MKITKEMKKPKAYRVVVYGTEGIGKTTFASKMPAPLFVDIERGAHGLDIATIDISKSITLEEMMGIINELILDHQGYKTLVIDSLDTLEKQLTQQICDEYKADSIEKVAAYGRGYNYVKERFGRLLDKLSALVESGVNVVCVGHSQLKTQALPDEQGSFDRYELKLQKQIASIVKEWCDTLLFVNYKTTVVEVQGEMKKKAQGGKRWAYSEHRPAFDAKHRASLVIPEDCSLEKATELLFKALSDTTTKEVNIEKPVAENHDEVVNTAGQSVNTGTESGESNIANDVVVAKPDNSNAKPHIARLRKMLKQYDVTDAQIEAYAAPKLRERFGITGAKADDFPKDFCDWLCRGMDKIAQKCK